MTDPRIADAVFEVGEADMPPHPDPHSYRPPYVTAKRDLVLVGQPMVNCNVRRLVWPAHAKPAREVESWGDGGTADLQARFGAPVPECTVPRWRAPIAACEFVEVHLRMGRAWPTAPALDCEPALLVQEENAFDSKRAYSWLVPLLDSKEALTQKREGAPHVHLVAQPDRVFRGFRVVCEPVHGSLRLVRVSSLRMANIEMLAGEGDVSAGIFHKLVAPELSFPILHPANRMQVQLCNLGPEPVRVRVRIEGKELREGVWEDK